MTNLLKIFSKETFPFPQSPENFWLLSNPGVDRLRAYFWSFFTLSRMDKCRDFGGARRLGRLWRKFAFPPQMRPGYDFFNFYMNKEHILFIQSLRNDSKSCTNRYLSQKFKEKFRKTNVSRGCQYDGECLSRYAFELTKDERVLS